MPERVVPVYRRLKGRAPPRISRGVMPWPSSPMLRRSIACGLIYGLRTAGVPAAAKAAGANEPVAAKPALEREEPPAGFNEWIGAFRARAAEAGISSEILDRALSGVRFNAKVVELSESQPEFDRPIWDYLDNAVSDKRIERGRELVQEDHGALNRAATEYGVPESVIAAIWGMESSFGEQSGRFSVVEALATLGFKEYHGAYGREQLTAALKILQAGDVSPPQMSGSWAGAMGQTQFIPTVFLRYARDGNGDGKRDVWGTEADVFASIANYLHGKGWVDGGPCFDEVRLPESFDYAAADMSNAKPVSAWANMGVAPGDDGRSLSGYSTSDSNALSTIALPAGHLGPAFVLYPNFKAVLAYNNAFSYGLAVCQLAKRLDQGQAFKTAWPREQVPLLSRTERIELQTLLGKLKYDAGEADGVIGQRARRAVRDYQTSAGLVPDGYPTAALLAKLRETPGN